MTKKFLSLLIAPVLAFINTTAQQVTGGWDIYPMVGATTDNVIDTPSKVYYLTGETLYSFSQSDNEHYTYSTQNKLSDYHISDIYYNYEKKYLLVAYDNGNIDLLYDDGRTVNMPEIKDAVLTSGHGITCVAFGHGRIFLGTEFGLVVYDDERHEVVESGIYDQKLDNVFLLGDNLMIVSKFSLYASPYTERHNTLDKFNYISGIYCLSVQPVNDTEYLFVWGSDNNIYRAKINFGNNTLMNTATNIPLSNPLKRNSNGIYSYDGTDLLKFDANGYLTQRISIPTGVRGQLLSTAGDEKSVWFGGNDGISHYDLSSGTLLHDAFKPEGLTCTSPAYLRWSADGQRLYVTNQGVTYLYIPNGDNYDIQQTTNIISDEGITDVSVETYDASADLAYWQKQWGHYGIVGGVGPVAEDPDDPSIYYIASAFDGIIVVKDKKFLKRFDKTNAPIVSGWGSRIYDINIDHEGNLWAGFWNESGKAGSPYIVLPAAKRRNIEAVVSSDWVSTNFPSSRLGNKDMRSLICTKSNMAFFADGGWETGILAVDTKGTLTNTKDDTYCVHTTFYDTEGHQITPSRITKLIEDTRGQVWVGTTSGVFVIQRPAEASSPELRIKRPLVPRNDGTNYGDYLVETELIYDIAIDATDRKWIATQGSGVYLVSEDGNEIIENYTSSNSLLPSNMVFSVTCDPLSNRVYFGTDKGLVSYNGNSAPASPDYSDVYAYPNPVRPDYTGWITITGLMDNSLVKIADIAGNVFFQGRSEGGLITWDGCNAAGERVKSGVYLVFASQNASGSASGVVTKIMVVN